MAEQTNPMKTPIEMEMIESIKNRKRMEKGVLDVNAKS